MPTGPLGKDPDLRACFLSDVQSSTPGQGKASQLEGKSNLCVARHHKHTAFPTWSQQQRQFCCLWNPSAPDPLSAPNGLGGDPHKECLQGNHTHTARGPLLLHPESWECLLAPQCPEHSLQLGSLAQVREGSMNTGKQVLRESWGLAFFCISFPPRQGPQSSWAHPGRKELN